MRTFIAVPLPAAVHSILNEIAARLRSFHADVRWVSAGSIHLTLAFLGEIDPAIVPSLASQLRQASARHPAMTLRLDRLGAFPNLRSPRVFWCGIAGDTGALQDLQKQVEEVCEGFGYAPETRGFHPHLTLGRVRGKSDLQPLLDYIRIGPVPEFSYQADRYHVYRSLLSPRGATYTVLETIPLKARTES